MNSEPGMLTLLNDGEMIKGNFRQEWAVRYRDPQGVMGAQNYHFIPVSGPEAAKNVASWHHQPWDNREKEVVSRLVTDWETPG